MRKSKTLFSKKDLSERHVHRLWNLESVDCIRSLVRCVLKLLDTKLLTSSIVSAAICGHCTVEILKAICYYIICLKMCSVVRNIARTFAVCNIIWHLNTGSAHKASLLESFGLSVGMNSLTGKGWRKN